MECRIILLKMKGGIEVGRIENIAKAEGHPGIVEFFGPLIEDLTGAITSAILTVSLGGLAGAIIPGSQFLPYYWAAKKAANDAVNIVNDILGASNSSCYGKQEIQLEESEEFDEIIICYHAYSEDELKKDVCKPVFVPPQAHWQQPYFENEKYYICNVAIKTSALENGLYELVFGAVDDGWKYDVAALSYLVLNWKKKRPPEVHCTSLRQLSESMDPPFSSRSLKEVARILDVEPPYSLRCCCEERSKYRSIQEARLSIFVQNAALFPENLGEIDIFGVMQIPVFDLYAGTNRQASINSFIEYLRAEQPDIAGFCEFWVPEERSQLKNSLKDIYPLEFCVEGPSGRAPGYTTIMDGGLLLLSKCPIITCDQMIYTACQSEDCFNAKGALYASIVVPGYPCPIYVFLTHLQSCPVVIDESIPRTGCGPGEGCWEKLKVFQVGELRDFVKKKASQGPCILMGDFNLHADVEDRYNALIGGLGNPIDSWKSVVDHGYDVFWPGSAPKNYQWSEIEVWHDEEYRRGMTNGGRRAFKPTDADCAWNDLSRQKDGGRIDYILGWPGPTSTAGYQLSFARSRVVMILLNEVRDASDHYGLRVDIKAIRELR